MFQMASYAAQIQSRKSQTQQFPETSKLLSHGFQLVISLCGIFPKYKGQFLITGFINKILDERQNLLMFLFRLLVNILWPVYFVVFIYLKTNDCKRNRDKAVSFTLLHVPSSGQASKVSCNLNKRQRRNTKTAEIYFSVLVFFVNFQKKKSLCCFETKRKSKC